MGCQSSALASAGGNGRKESEALIPVKQDMELADESSAVEGCQKLADESGAVEGFQEPELGLVWFGEVHVFGDLAVDSFWIL